MFASFRETIFNTTVLIKHNKYVRVLSFTAIEVEYRSRDFKNEHKQSQKVSSRKAIVFQLLITFNGHSLDVCSSTGCSQCVIVIGVQLTQKDKDRNDSPNLFASVEIVNVAVLLIKRCYVQKSMAGNISNFIAWSDSQDFLPCQPK